MKRVVGYVISEKNNFVSWAYKGVSAYYMAKVVEEYDNISGEIVERYYAPLNDKFAYKNELISRFRGLEVEEI